MEGDDEEISRLAIMRKSGLKLLSFDEARIKLNKYEISGLIIG